VLFYWGKMKLYLISEELLRIFLSDYKDNKKIVDYCSDILRNKQPVELVAENNLDLIERDFCNYIDDYRENNPHDKVEYKIYIQKVKG